MPKAKSPKPKSPAVSPRAKTPRSPAGKRPGTPGKRPRTPGKRPPTPKGPPAQAKPRINDEPKINVVSSFHLLRNESVGDRESDYLTGETERAKSVPRRPSKEAHPSHGVRRVRYLP
ncbi:hypothetical protein RvY_14462 [Ramazzottius varieornatus]|uniref:Uncharacterized protein n=1 Tax=Ramazzottius varieornatus TaxID=947166 RepID=A0A1D1VWG4_RAMVA|nr:hypothetical protein RvY_14462 [Ramazzottius varieornatus]